MLNPTCLEFPSACSLSLLHFSDLTAGVVKHLTSSSDHCPAPVFNRVSLPKELSTNSSSRHSKSPILGFQPLFQLYLLLLFYIPAKLNYFLFSKYAVHFPISATLLMLSHYQKVLPLSSIYIYIYPLKFCAFFKVSFCPASPCHLFSIPPSEYYFSSFNYNCLLFVHLLS